MPLFSAFTPFNMLKFSSAPSRGESIYRSMYSAKVQAFDLSQGTYQEGKVYGQSMGIARARYALERAQNQLDPFKCIELLPALEKDWAVVPLETDTLLDRQAAVAAKMILVRGARREAVEAGLRVILGTHYVSLRGVPSAEVLASTTSTQNFSRPELPGKYIRLTSPVSITGIGYEVAYTTADSSAVPVSIVKGDMLTMSPENIGLKEVVTVSSARAGFFTSTFGRAHDINSFATTDNYVDWMSTQRMLYVVVDDYAARSAELCRRVNDFMGRACSGVTEWHIIEPTAPSAVTLGPFTLNISPLGAVPIGSLSLYPPNTPEFGILPNPGTSSGQSVTMYGRYLTGATLVRINGISMAFTNIDDYHLTLTITPVLAPFVAGGLSYVTQFPIEVTTPAGVTTRSFPNGYGVTPAALSITSRTPTTGPTATVVNVVGTGFLSITNIAVNGITLTTPWTIIDDNRLTLTTNTVGGEPTTKNIDFTDGYGRVVSTPFLFT